MVRALGDSKTSLIFLAFCSVLNIILDLIFVVPLGMGVIGAAVATVLSQAVAAVACIAYAFQNYGTYLAGDGRLCVLAL